MGLADIFDAIQELNFSLIQVNSKRKIQKKHKKHWRPFEFQDEISPIKLKIANMTAKQAEQTYNKYRKQKED